jgi:hypothetical protein
MRTQYFYHLLERFTLTATLAFEGAGLEVFELLVGHGCFLLTYFYPPPPYSRKVYCITDVLLRYTLADNS